MSRRFSCALWLRLGFVDLVSRDSNKRPVQLCLSRLDRQDQAKKASAQRLTPSPAVACIQLCLRACELAFGCEGSRANFCRCFPERKVPIRTPLEGPIGSSLQHPSSPCSPADRPGPEAGDSNVPLFPFCQKLHVLGCRIEQVLTSGLLRGRSNRLAVEPFGKVAGRMTGRRGCALVMFSGVQRVGLFHPANARCDASHTLADRRVSSRERLRELQLHNSRLGWVPNAIRRLAKGGQSWLSSR